MGRRLVGGLEDLGLRKSFGRNTRLDLSSSGLHQNDYTFEAGLRRENLGYLRVNFREWRHFYHDTNRFYSTLPDTPRAVFRLDKGGLQADRSNLFLELGLTPANLPSLSFSYERSGRRGEMAPYWGSLVESADPNPVRFRPIVKDIAGITHTYKLAAEYRLGSWRFALGQAWESYDDSTFIRENLFDRLGDLEDVRLWQGKPSYHSAATSFEVEGHPASWLRASLGYRYQHLRNDSSFSLEFFEPSGETAAGLTDLLHPAHNGSSESHVGTASLVFGPFKGLSLTPRFRVKDSQTSGFAFSTTGLTVDEEGESNLGLRTSRSRRPETTLGGGLGLRYTGIPRVALRFDVELERSDVSYREQHRETGLTSFFSFRRRTEADLDRTLYTLGADWRPVRWTSLSLQYRRTDKNYDYSNRLLEGFALMGYPGHLGDRDTVSDELGLRATLKPWRALDLTLEYRQERADYQVKKESPDKIASFVGRTLSGGLSLWPMGNLSLSAFYSFQHLEGSGRASSGLKPIRDYGLEGQRLQTNARFAFNSKTTFTASYRLQTASGSLDHTLQGLGVGMEYALPKGLKLLVDYGYYDYDDRENYDVRVANIDSYTAHTALLRLKVEW